MNAEVFAIENSGNWKCSKQDLKLSVEDRTPVKAHELLLETVGCVDLGELVIAAEEEDIVWKSDCHCDEKSDYFD